MDVTLRILRYDSERDDKKWLKHTLAYKGKDGPDLRYKQVSITRFEPKPRTY